MKVSIVTISYNQSEFLERAIRSVLDQDYPDIEYIVVDPGSTDGSRDVIERYRSRLAQVILDPDDGPADGLNRGLAAATGAVFSYLNADDRLLPEAVSRAVATFADDPQAAVVYGHGYIEDQRNGESYRVNATTPVSRWRLAFGGVFLLQQASFYRTDAVRAAGGFNPDNRTCWDAELVAELVLARQRFRRIDAALAVFTLHGTSISGSGAQEARYHRDWERIVARLLDRGPRPSDRFRRLLARALKWVENPAALAVRLRRLADRHQPMGDRERSAGVAMIATHIAPAKGFGGIAECTGALARAWAAQGRPFRLCSSDASLEDQPLTAAAIGMPSGVAVNLYHARWFPRWGFGWGACQAVFRACRNAGVVYIAGVATWPTTLAAISCTVLRRRFVIATHGGLMVDHVAEIRRFKWHKWLFYQALTLPTLRAAATIHACSALEADGIRRLLPEAPIAIVANGIDLSDWPALPPRPAEPGRTFCYIGRFSVEKGIHRFLRLWLECRRSDDRFLIAGSGRDDYGRAVEALVRASGPAVTRFDYLEPAGVRQVLADSDFLVLPSGIDHGGLRENFGVAVAEALAVGRPALVARGLAWDAIETAGGGLLFDPDDTAIRAVIGQAQALPPDRLAAMGRAARRYAETHLDLARTSALLWDRITATGGPPVASTPAATPAGRHRAPGPPPAPPGPRPRERRTPAGLDRW